MSYYEDPGSRTHKQGRVKLNEYWVDGQGIHPDVIKRKIGNFLGPEAFAESASQKGVKGYLVTAVRPFTSHMLDDLRTMSLGYDSSSRRPETYTAGSFPTSSPRATNPYSQPLRQNNPPYNPVAAYNEYPAAEGYPSLPDYRPQSEYSQVSAVQQASQQSRNREQPHTYTGQAGLNYPAGGGYPSSAYPMHPTRDPYAPSGNTIPGSSLYQSAQATYEPAAPYRPMAPDSDYASQGPRPLSTGQQLYPPVTTGYPSSGYSGSGYPGSGHQTSQATVLTCPDCDYTSSRASDMNFHMQTHYTPGTSTGGRRSAR